MTATPNISVLTGGNASGTLESLLATTRVWLMGSHDHRTYARALLPRRRVNVLLEEGARDAGEAHSVARVTLQSVIIASCQIEFDALVLSRLTNQLSSKLMSGTIRICSRELH